MSKSINKTFLIGNVGKAPDVLITTNHNMVANFTLATNDVFIDGHGESHETTEWHYLVAFGRTAEIIRDYVEQGSRLYIEGKIQTNSWKDKVTGEPRYRKEIIIRDLSLLSFKHSNGDGAQQGAQQGAQSQPDSDCAYSQTGEDADSIPF